MEWFTQNSSSNDKNGKTGSFANNKSKLLFFSEIPIKYYKKELRIPCTILTSFFDTTWKVCLNIMTNYKDMTYNS